MNSIGLYVHIPFCESKCPYCDFYSKKPIKDNIIQYTDFLEEKLKTLSFPADTLYIGGGTPSLCDTQTIENIISAVNPILADDSEITMEINPKSALNLDFTRLASAGLNRVSIGLQSAVDSELFILGREHSAADVLNLTKNLKKNGINNISLDVMVGIPNQTMDSLKRTLDFIIECDVPHVSAYMLTIEENTLFYKQKEKLNLPNEEKQVELYKFLSKFLQENLYEHYEISNFCRDEMYSRHNLKYWNCEEYIGIGPSAHSFLNGKRYYYPRNLKAFYENQIINDDDGGSPEEYIMLRMRLNRGLVFNEFIKRFNEAVPVNIINNAKRLQKFGLVKIDSNAVSLTENGILLSNSVIASLLYD